MAANKAELFAQLNLETGKLSWAELEPHFARGAVVKVAPELDLVAVAAAVAADERAAVAGWLGAGQMARADAEDALRWHSARANFWAVVVAPWVLAQEIGVEQ